MKKYFYQDFSFILFHISRPYIYQTQHFYKIKYLNIKIQEKILIYLIKFPKNKNYLFNILSNQEIPIISVFL